MQLITQSACFSGHGLDNDNDGLIDWVSGDPGCASVTDLTEIDESGTFPCDDGLDNDRDGLTDAEDPGCPTPDDPDERTPGLVCDDGLDNDGDGLIDLRDWHCFGNPFGGSEHGSCGLGFEVTLLLLPLMWLRQRRRLHGRQQ